MNKQLPNVKNKTYLCERCLVNFTLQENLKRHLFDCRNLKTKITLPTEQEKTIEFKNFKNKEKVPFVLYADIKSTLKNYEDVKHTQSLQRYQKHEPFSIAYYLKCSYDDSLSKFILGADCQKWFGNELQGIAYQINDI